MAVGIYDTDQHPNDIIHRTSVDFIKPIINTPIHLMQYDNTLPVIAVELFKDNVPYILPDTENVYMYVRWGLKDHSFIHKPILGKDKNIDNLVYFDVEEVMLIEYGSLNPILEIVIEENYISQRVTPPDSEEIEDIIYNKRIAGSSYIRIEVDKNPIQKSDIESAYRLAKLVDVDMVISNPPVTTESPVLNSLGIGDINYILPNGTPVIPNPTGELINDRLKSAKIGNDTYGVFTADEKNGDTISPIVGIVFEKITNNQEN